MLASGGSSSHSEAGGAHTTAESADGDADAGLWAEAQARVAPHLASASTAAEALQQVQELWPAWTAAGCRPHAGQAEQGPSAEEAAAALQLLARRALPMPPQRRQQELARHRCVRGLVQALRLEAPSSAGPTLAARGSRAGGLRSAESVAAALWAMAVLGGSARWEGEADALCALLPACRFASLKQARAAAASQHILH